MNVTTPSVSLERLRDKLKLGSSSKTSSSNQHAKTKDVSRSTTTKGSKVSAVHANEEDSKFPSSGKKSGVASHRIVPGFNLFDRAAKGLLKSDVIIASPSAPFGSTGSVTMTTSSTHAGKDLSVQPLDLSKITPALKNVKQVSPPAAVKIDLTGGPGELPLDLSTKKRPPDGAGEGSGVSPPKKVRNSRTSSCVGAGLVGKATVRDVYGGQCASCRASRHCTCAHKEGAPKPAHTHAHQSNLNSHLNAAPTNVSERNLNSSNGGGNNNASVIASGINPGDTSGAHTAARTEELAKPFMSTDSTVVPTRTGRYSPIELPKQRMTQTLKGQGIVNHRGRAFIVSPVRPQIKGQPVDASCCAAMTSAVKSEAKAQTTTSTPSVPSISTTLDNVVSCKPNFEVKNTELKLPEGFVSAQRSIVNTVHTESSADFFKATGPLLNVPNFTPNVQKVKVKKNKKSTKELKSEKKKLKKLKRESSVTDDIISPAEVTNCDSVSPESTSSVTSSKSAPEGPSGVRLPRHIMVARKSTRPHKPTRKVLEMVETSDFLESPTKATSPTKSPSSATDGSPPEGLRSLGNRTRETELSPESPAAGKVRTVPKKFTRTSVTQKGGRLGDKVTSPVAKVTSSTSPIKDDVMSSKKSVKKNLPAFMPTTSENEALISPLKLDVLTTTSHSTFNPPVTKATDSETEVSDNNGSNPCASALESTEEAEGSQEGTRLSLVPEHYSYPSDTEPHHIPSCPDWREDLIKYKRDRLHLPPKIISVPKHTKPNFKAPAYVEIPKCTRMFGANKKTKMSPSSSSPSDAKPSSAIKLTITGPSITMHEYPKGTSPRKPAEKPESPVTAQKPPVLSIPPSVSDNVSSAPKSPVGGSVSNLARLVQQKKELKRKSLKLSGGGTKHMSPLMKKVHKELKRERHRIASCSPGRSTVGGVGGKSPVRSESPGSASSMSPPALLVRSNSAATCSKTSALHDRSTHAPDTGSGLLASSGSTGTQSVPRPASSDVDATELDVTNMTLEELGYEKVKPLVASPSKHFATSTMQKLAERLGISVGRGNGLIKPNTTLICNPATNTAPFKNLKDKINKLKKKSKKKKKYLEELKMSEKEEVCSSAEDNTGKKKKSKKKKKDKKKKKLKEKEKEGVAKSETKDVPKEETTKKLTEDKTTKKQKTLKNVSNRKETKTPKLKKTKSVVKKNDKIEEETRKKKNESPKKGVVRKFKDVKLGKNKNPVKKGKMTKKQRLEEEKRKQRELEEEEEEERKKRKRRSMLDELRNSDGYVAEKRFKKHENLLVDPSELGREERALQRAMMKIAEMEQQTSPPPVGGGGVKTPPSTTTSPSGGAQSAQEQTTASNVKKAKANKALGLKKRAINSGRNKGRAGLAAAAVGGATRKSTFVDFIPVVLETRTRHQTSVYCEVMNGDVRLTDESSPEKDETYTPNHRSAQGEPRRKPGRPSMQAKNRESSARKERQCRKTPVIQRNHLSGTEDDSDSSDDDSASSSSSSASWSESDVTISPEIPTTPKRNNTTTPKLQTLSEGRRGRGRGRYNRQRSLMKLPDPVEPHSEITSSDIADLARQATLELHSSLSTADTLSVKDYSSFGDGSQFGDARPLRANASKYVMWKGKRLGATQKTGEKLLHKAARMGYEDVCLHCIQQCPEDVNAQENAGFTPLHEACSIGHIVIARMLLAHGANVNVCSHNGLRPLHDAIDNDSIELARLLISCGADINLGSFSGVPVLKMAKSNEMKKFLRGCMSDLNGRRDETGEAWEFFGSSVTDELDSDDEENGTGCDVFADVPSDSDVSCDADDVMFDFSDSITPATIALCVDKDKGVANYVFFDDLLEHVGLSRYYFMRRHPDVRVIAVPQREWRRINGEATKNQLDLPKTALDTCRWRSYVELVEYDDDIKKILGVSTESLALNAAGSEVLYHVHGSETRTGKNRHDFLENAEIKSEPLDDADFRLYDEEDIDMNYYCGNYDNDGNLSNDTYVQGYADGQSPSDQGQVHSKVKVKSEKVTDATHASPGRTSSDSSWSVKKLKRTKSSSENFGSHGDGSRRSDEGGRVEAPLSPSFHRPWDVPQSPKAQPKQSSTPQPSSAVGSVYPAAKSPRLTLPGVQGIQTQRLSSPGMLPLAPPSPAAQQMLHLPQHASHTPSPYTLSSPQPYLLNTPQRPEPSLSAGPYPFHHPMSSPTALPLYPSYQGVARDYPHSASPMRELSRVHHGYQGLPPAGYHGYPSASPSHAAGRLVSLVPRPGMSPSPGPSLAALTHEQQSLTLEHLQLQQHLRTMQAYHHPYHPR